MDDGALGLFNLYNINGGGDNTSSLDNISSLTVTVNPVITPVPTWANPADITYGTALGATQLDATTTVPGSYVYTPAAGTVPSAGADETLSVTFTPTDTTDYGPVTATAMINVNRATLLITANSATRVYGQQNPAFTVTYAGLTNGDSPSSLGGSLTSAQRRPPRALSTRIPLSRAASRRRIMPSLSRARNSVVTPASLTITANNQSRVYGQPNPPLTVYYQGFVNGDTATSLTTQPTVTTTATNASPVGPTRSPRLGPRGPQLYHRLRTRASDYNPSANANTDADANPNTDADTPTVQDG